MTDIPTQPAEVERDELRKWLQALREALDEDDADYAATYCAEHYAAEYLVPKLRTYAALLSAAPKSTPPPGPDAVAASRAAWVAGKFGENWGDLSSLNDSAAHIQETEAELARATTAQRERSANRLRAQACRLARLARKRGLRETMTNRRYMRLWKRDSERMVRAEKNLAELETRVVRLKIEIRKHLSPYPAIDGCPCDDCSIKRALNAECGVYGRT